MSVARKHDAPSHGAQLLAEAASLLAPLRDLQRRLTQRLLLSELLQLAILLLAAAMLVMTLDATFRWRTPAPRWIGSLSVLTLLLASFVLMLRRRAWSMTLLGLVGRLEELFPHLRGQLRPAVALAETPSEDPLAGASTLRVRLLQRAEQAVAQINLAELVQDGRLRGRLLLLGAIISMLAIWSIAAPQSVWRAGRRLLAPWRTDPWPRLVVLEIDIPAKAARGADVLVAVHSKTPHFPSSATLYTADDSGRVWSQPMRREEGRFTSTLNRIQTPLWLRVVGGDDDQMPWRRLEVVEPVHLTVARLEAFPPAYTRAPSFRVGADAVLLEGTRLSVEFRTSRPIRSAEPILAGERLPRLKIDPSGRRAWGEFVVAAPASGGTVRLQLDIRDEEDALSVGAYRGAIKVVRDSPPSIEWREPQGATKVQPASQLPIVARIADDIRIDSLQLRRREIPQGADASEDPPSWQTHLLIPLEEETREYTLTETLDFAPLGVQPGDVVEWMLVAVDAKGQVKESDPLRCAVVEPEELRRDGDRRLERLLEQLYAAALRQRETALALRQSSGRRDSAELLAQIRAARFDEHAILEMLNGPAGGLLESWKAWLAQREAHQLVSEEDRERFEQVTEALELTSTRDLPNLLEKLDRAALQSQTETLQQEVGDAALNAAAIRDRLQDAVDRLAQWRRWAQATQTIDEVLSAQQQLLEQTRDAAIDLLGRLPEELSEAERERLENLSDRQSELAQQLAELPPPPSSVAAAWSQARSEADEAMRQASRDLTRNQLSQASQHQERAMEAMRRLSSDDALRGAPSTAEPPRTGETPPAPRAGPTAEQVQKALERQIAIREETERIVQAIQRSEIEPNAAKQKLAELAKEQADLAQQLEAWQAAIDAERDKEKSP